LRQLTLTAASSMTNDVCSDESFVPVNLILTDKKIRRGVHKSVQALEADIRDWIDQWNQNPRPFAWTKTAEEILNSLAEYLSKISGGAH
jgi:hypothetical protein